MQSRLKGLRFNFREVAGAVTELEFGFEEVGVGDLDGYLAIGTVAFLVS